MCGLYVTGSVIVCMCLGPLGMGRSVCVCVFMSLVYGRHA